MTVFILVFTVLFFVAAVIGLGIDEILIEYQYKNYKDAWIEDGKPRGVFLNISDSSQLSFMKRSFSSWDTRYKWAIGDEHAMRLVSYMNFLRKMIILFSILFVPVIHGKSMNV